METLLQENELLKQFYYEKIYFPKAPEFSDLQELTKKYMRKMYSFSLFKKTKSIGKQAKLP
jgi:hypothetical protein